MRIRSTSPEMTQQIAAELAKLVRLGDLVALTGRLGAGKTCFAQGLARGLGIREVVASPSFVIAKHYRGAPGLLHVDAYRLCSAEEFWQLGLEEQMESNVTVIEWADNVTEALPDRRIDLRIECDDGEVRTIHVSGRPGRPSEVVGHLRGALSTGQRLGWPR